MKLILIAMLLAFILGCVLVVGDKNQLDTNQEATVGISEDK